MGGWTYNSGQFNLYCDVCAKKIKAGQAKHRWDGLIVCPDDWEERQPQDFVKAKLDKIMVPFSRPTENTSNNLTYGMFDVVRFKEDPNPFVAIVEYPQDYVDMLESVVTGKGVVPNETLPLLEEFFVDVAQQMNIQDLMAVTNTGTGTILDYVDITYFELDNVYVGTVSTFGN